MKTEKDKIIEEIQQLVAKIVATSRVSQNLPLIGGFRFRFLDGSPRMSLDIDYHWQENLEEKQKELIALFRRKLLREVRHKYGYTGTATPASGPDADSHFVKIINLNFYKEGVFDSRIEIPVDITRIEHLDDPIVRTHAGTVFLTLSERDLIESKVLAIFNRLHVETRDIVDIFLFADRMDPDSRLRIERKMSKLCLKQEELSRKMKELIDGRNYFVRSILEIIKTQIDEETADRIMEGGGAEMVFDTVVHILREKLKIGQEQ